MKLKYKYVIQRKKRKHLRNATDLAVGESVFGAVTVSILISLGLKPFCIDVRFLADEPAMQKNRFD